MRRGRGAGLPGYADYCGDYARTGLVSGVWGRGLGERLLRRAARALDRVESLLPTATGPRWPHAE